MERRCDAAEQKLRAVQKQLHIIDRNNYMSILDWLKHYGLLGAVQGLPPKAELSFFKQWVPKPTTAKSSIIAFMTELADQAKDD